MVWKTGLIVAALTLTGQQSAANTYIDTMKGVGSARIFADGSSGFTFAISENAYDGIIARSDKATLRAQHDYIIAAWVGSSGICQKGYKLAAPTVSSGVVLYEGRCK